MLLAMLVVGTTTLFFGALMLFSFETFRKMSVAMNKIVLEEQWFHTHRVALGILMIGLTGFLYTGAYYMLKFGVS